MPSRVILFFCRREGDGVLGNYNENTQRAIKNLKNEIFRSDPPNLSATADEHYIGGSERNIQF